MSTATQPQTRKRKLATPEQAAARMAEERLQKENPAAWRSGKLRVLAGKRIPAAIKRIKMCSNLAAYKPTEEQAVAICDALQAAINSMRVRLRGERDAPKKFDLP
jgi:hypothetical protein